MGSLSASSPVAISCTRAPTPCARKFGVSVSYGFDAALNLQSVRERRRTTRGLYVQRRRARTPVAPPESHVLMEEVIARYRCVGDDKTPLVVLEYRHLHQAHGSKGVRRHVGARRLALGNGASVRYIDAETFEVIQSGELLRRLD